jgi:SAM-dependent methyltransferase
MSMDGYLEGNRDHWDEMAPHHERSEFYDVDGFKAGGYSLKSIELEELGDVSGKSLLHLQCHFGMDTLSWARLGASVTGIDFSDAAISRARHLSTEIDVPATFICANIYDLPDVLQGQFDIVYTSYGVQAWLPDIPRWAEIAAHFLKPGGTFYIAENHPLIHLFDDAADRPELTVTNPYWGSPEPTRFEPDCSYAGAPVTKPSYEWTHTMGEIVTSLTAAGLRIEHLHEFPLCEYQALPQMKKDDRGYWRLEGDPLPLLFSIKATKPE